MDKINTIWSEVLSLIKEDLNSVSFNTWFKPIKPLEIYNNIFFFEAPEDFLRNMLVKRYNNLIINALKEITNEENVDIQILIPGEKINKKKLTSTSLNTSVDNTNDETSFLNKKYKFDSFIIGNGNRFAHAAALAVAESPSSAYNPLFLYGGVGLGKTHLMHAIGHYILSNNPSSKILYATSEKFTNDLINSIKDDKNDEFRNKYRKSDVLLIDDIQFIAGKERTQEEFFHTFNALHSANKQIIISSDRPPKEIPAMEDRLRSRFEGGLIADIQPPDLETRIAILRKKAEDEKYEITNEVIDYIATNVHTNIRKLEGALIRLCAYSSLTNKKINLDLAIEALKHLVSDEQKIITSDVIKKYVCERYNISIKDMDSKKKPKNISYPRQIAMFLTRKHTDEALACIGKNFGGRDHSTVLHAFNKISKNIETDFLLKKDIEELETELL